MRANLMKRLFLGVAAFSGLMFFSIGQPAAAQTYPDHPIRFIVPFSAGGGGDYIARALLSKLSDYLGQPLIIENRGAGNTVVGTNVVAKSPPDGYTILLVNPQYTSNPSLQPNLPYKTPDDFQSVALIMSYQMHMFGHAKVPFDSIPGLIDYAKKNPGVLNYGSAGLGSSGHIAGELFKKMTGTDIVHVPYNGAGPAANGIIGGHVQLLFTGMSQLQGAMSSGYVKLIGAGCSEHNKAPVRTICEQGVPGFDSLVWWAILAPAGTPRPIVDKLNAAFRHAAADPDIQKRFAVIDGDASVSTPEALDKLVRSDIAKLSAMTWDAPKPQ
jgi:tripartite-type tricarboxylate transporter receptor subunit TctC